MNTEVKMTYLKYLLLAGVMCALASCQREDCPMDLPEEGKPIELSATSDWSNLTKGPISSLGDLNLDGDEEDGFLVWGNHTNIYDETAPVFEKTEVSAVFDGDEFSYWDYSPKQYWQQGTYVFAGILPASKLKATISAEMTADGNLTIKGGVFTLGGKSANGTELAPENQIDLMYALSGEVDNTERTDDPVSLIFKHLWTKVGFNLMSVEPTGKAFDVSRIKIYGSGLYSAIDLSEELTITDDEEDNLTSISKITLGNTDEDSPFAQFSCPDDVWDVAAEPVPLVENLMVFPMELSEDNSVIVEVTYSNGKILKGILSDGTWLSGKTYIYTLQLGTNSIVFAEPKVTPWIPADDNLDIDIVQ